MTGRLRTQITSIAIKCSGLQNCCRLNAAQSEHLRLIMMCLMVNKVVDRQKLRSMVNKLGFPFKVLGIQDGKIVGIFITSSVAQGATIGLLGDSDD